MELQLKQHADDIERGLVNPPTYEIPALPYGAQYTESGKLPLYMVDYRGERRMCMRCEDGYREYDYIKKAVGDLFCGLGEEESCRGTSSFDF